MGLRRDYVPIGSYAVVGDCATVALISRGGRVDWMLWPTYEDLPVFAHVLDARRGGFTYLRPRDGSVEERHYVTDTNVLQTTYRTPTGTAVVTDVMAVTPEPSRIRADHELLRRVECVDGEVDVEMVCAPRCGLRRSRPRFRRRGELGYCCSRRGTLLAVRSDLELGLTDGDAVVEGFGRLRAGERCHVSLACQSDLPGAFPPLGDAADRRIELSVEFWRRWMEGCTYEGQYPEAVHRSALILKLLSYAPSGAIIAAATTSLPERAGGERNWDYRYVWIRDAAFIVRALTELGFDDEARAFFDWLMHATRSTSPRLMVLYDVHGSSRVKEHDLDDLDGYRGSRPVRVGNAAVHQLQLDTYGQLLAATYALSQEGRVLDAAEIRHIARIGRFVEEHWDDPSDGIWEARSGRGKHTLGCVMCWVAIDRMCALYESGDLPGDSAPLRQLQRRIRDEVEARGVGGPDDTYVTFFGEDLIDASLLLLPLFGYIDADHPRMQRTLARIERELGVGALTYRYGRGYPDGLDSPENPFLVCSFWRVEVLARAGRGDEARALFEELLTFANDVGVYSEEVSEDHESFGNVPQGLSHMGLIHAALTLEEIARGREVTAMQGERSETVQATEEDGRRG